MPHDDTLIGIAGLSDKARTTTDTRQRLNGQLRMHKPQIFCFPQAGADSGCFKAWEPLIGSTADICPVPLPGRGLRLDDPLLTNFQILCDQIFSEIIATVRPPFFLMGSSMGGWMAYEIALRFERHGQPPNGIITLSSPMPAPLQRLPELNNPETVVADIIGVNPVFAEVAQYPELLDMILPVLKADFRMCNAYRPDAQNTVAIPILGFAGTEDPLVPPDAMRGWHAFTSAGFRLCAVPGDHDLHENPDVAMAAEVRAFLASCQRAETGCDV